MNRKIEFDRPKPSSDEILSRRDFDALLSKAQQGKGKIIRPPFWKTSNFYASIVVAAAVLVVAVLIVNNQDMTGDKQQQNVVVNPIQSPDNSDIKKLGEQLTQLTQNPDHSFKRVSADKGGSLVIKNTVIEIPAQALVDASGNLVKGDIDLRYQTLDTPADFFLNNIPMSDKNSSTGWAYVSAEMIEVSAWQNGKELSLQPGKELEIQLPVVEGYSAYQLEGSVWLGLSPSTEPEVSSLNNTLTGNEAELSGSRRAGYEQLLNRRDEEIAAATQAITVPEIPLEPQRANRKKDRFTVDFRKSEFPEMAGYANVIFEVDESIRDFDPGIYNVQWENMTLQKTTHEGLYQLVLRKGIHVELLNVRPAIDGEAYEKALQTYSATKAKRTLALNSRDSIAATIRQRYENQLSAFFNQEPSEENRKNIVHMRRFGVVGLLRRTFYPEQSTVQLQLRDDKGNDLTIERMAHIERGQNTVFSWPENSISAFELNSQMQNQIWVVSKGMLYIAEEKAVSKAIQDKKFTLNLIPCPPSALVSSSAFRKYVGY